MGWLRGAALLLAAAWFGGACFLGFWLAPSLFARARNHDPAVVDSGAAGDLLAPYFHGFDTATVVVAGLTLVAAATLRTRGVRLLGGKFFLLETAAALAMALGAVGIAWLGPHAAELRARVIAAHGAYVKAPDDDPGKRAYAQAHGLSMASFSAVVLCAGLTILALGSPRPRTPA